MKKIAILIITSMIAYANMAKVEVIDNGVKRIIALPPISQARSAENMHKGFLVEFKYGVDVKEFAKKYNLTIRKKMSIGYWILDNRSKLDDITLLNKITSNETSKIKSIRPNWKRVNSNR